MGGTKRGPLHDHFMVHNTALWDKNLPMHECVTCKLCTNNENKYSFLSGFISYSKVKSLSDKFSIAKPIRVLLYFPGYSEKYLGNIIVYIIHSSEAFIQLNGDWRLPLRPPALLLKHMEIE